MKITPVVAQRIALAGLVLASLSVVLLVGAGPGHRFGLWHYRVSFMLMQWAVYGGLAAIAVSIPAAIFCARRHVAIFPSLVAVALGAVAAWIPWHQLQTARSLPPIHDITTDTAHPPQFVAIVKLRGAGSNPVEYDAAKLPAAQKAGYPDLETLALEAPVNEAWKRATAAADRMGWEVVATDESAGRIEATATTFWFGFKDDVVVRVAAGEGGKGSRVDVRSVSRVGQSDLGANAARIRKYLAALRGAP
jgi:hypothetical protein